MLNYTGFEQKPAACKVITRPLLNPPQAQKCISLSFLAI